VAVVVVFSALTRHHFLPPFDATLPAVLLGPQFVHCGGRGEKGTTDTSHHTSHQAALLDALGVRKLSRPQFHTEHFLPRLPRLDPGVRDGTMQHVLLDLQRLCRDEGGGVPIPLSAMTAAAGASTTTTTEDSYTHTTTAAAGSDATADSTAYATADSAADAAGVPLTLFWGEGGEGVCSVVWGSYST
jgi:hypothetical protein